MTNCPYMLNRHKRGLISLFARVHELQADPVGKRLLALEIQEELLEKIGRAEHAIRRIRGANKAIKARLAKPGNDREAARMLKEAHVEGLSKVETKKKLISTLRSIGDAVAFIYGDRWDLKQMMLNAEAGFITGKRGTRLERRMLRALFAMGATVVMNDLTHTLRYGDLTVFRSDIWPEGNAKFMIIEAKSGRGGNKKRAGRQMSSMKGVSDYLSTDARTGDDGNWFRVSCNSEPRHHFEVITRLAKSLPRNGWLTEKVEDGLYYSIIECGAEQNIDLAKAFSSIPLTEHSFMCLGVNEIKEQVLGYYPFPLCFRDPEVLFRFYNGEFVINVFLDITHINETLFARGLRIIQSANDLCLWQLVTATEERSQIEADIHIGFHPVRRLAAEFISLDWLMDNIIIGPPYDEMRQRMLDAQKAVHPLTSDRALSDSAE